MLNFELTLEAKFNIAKLEGNLAEIGQKTLKGLEGQDLHNLDEEDLRKELKDVLKIVSDVKDIAKMLIGQNVRYKFLLDQAIRKIAKGEVSSGMEQLQKTKGRRDDDPRL